MNKDKFREKIENDDTWTNEEIEEVEALFDDMETVNAITNKHCR